MSGHLSPRRARRESTGTRITEPADEAYRALDTNSRGYLTKGDVQGVAGFNFEQADTNHDGRLSKDEFARARNAKPQ